MKKFFATATAAALMAFANAPAHAGAVSPAAITPDVATVAPELLTKVSCGGVDCDAPRKRRGGRRGAKIAAGIALGVLGAIAASESYARGRSPRYDRYDRYEGRHERRCGRWRRACNRWDDFRACRRYERSC